VLDKVDDAGAEPLIIEVIDNVITAGDNPSAVVLENRFGVAADSGFALLATNGEEVRKSVGVSRN
jgi:hypothetical protein